MRESRLYCDRNPPKLISMLFDFCQLSRQNANKITPLNPTCVIKLLNVNTNL